MSPDQARALRMGDMVALTAPDVTFTLNLWYRPGALDGRLDEAGNWIVGEVPCGSLAMVLGVAEVSGPEALPEEPVEVLVLAGDSMGWVFASYLDGVCDIDVVQRQ